MKFPVCLLVLAVFTAVTVSCQTASPSAKRPNFIFILADDFGVGEVSCYGADNYKTPNIDRLAREGMRYTHAYTVSLCGPSRAQILTGRYPFRTGATNQDATGRFTPGAEIMMPKVLSQTGYVSAAIGKWGQLPLGPAEFGFDHFLKFQGSGAYWNTQAKARTYEVDGKKVPLHDQEYLPDVMHRTAVEFITRHREHPFYLYYSLSHVHTEILPTPDSTPDSKDLYSDNVRYLDKLVGRLLAELDRLKLREKTVIVFLGDNGTTNGRADRATIGGRRLAGAKGSMLEGGGLVPMIVSWPGTIAAGSVCADLVDSTDFFPTFAELAGARLPDKTVIDGHSLAPQWHGEKGQPRSWVFNQLARNWYVREAGWKLNQAGELYDMSDAPFSEKLVAVGSNDPDALAARQRLQATLTDLNPAGGTLDEGDGTGRHSNRAEKRKTGAKAKP
ncbi:MAG: sulfatase-like hydrolase/transferase [Opitutaceae bacterium]